MKSVFHSTILSLVLPLMAAPLLQGREINVRALAFQPGFPVELHAHEVDGTSTAGLVEVKSFLNHEFNVLNIKGNTVAFTRRSKPSSATSVAEVVTTVELPESKSAIILFSPGDDPQDKEHCKAHAIDDSPKAFPPGSFLVHNLTSSPVKIDLEKDSHEIAPGESKQITEIAWSPRQTANMLAYYQMDGEWKLISTGSWTKPGEKRVLEVFTEDPVTKQVELRGIRDVAAQQ